MSLKNKKIARIAPNIAFHGAPTRGLRGSGPVNSNR